MHLIESWGTGIRRIIEDCAQLNLPEPVFSEIGDAFRVEVYRKQAIQPATGQASTEQVPSKYRASTEQVPSKHRASTEQAPSKSLKSELKSSLNIVQLQGKEVKCRLSWDLLIENTLENHPATIA
jgi:predicted HTH transcriptional regulator